MDNINDVTEGYKTLYSLHSLGNLEHQQIYENDRPKDG